MPKRNLDQLSDKERARPVRIRGRLWYRCVMCGLPLGADEFSVLCQDCLAQVIDARITALLTKKKSA